MYTLVEKRLIKRAVKIFIGATLFLIIGTIITYFVNPLEDVTRDIASKTPESISEEEGLFKVWGFIKNNAFAVPLQILFLAIIPIPYLNFIVLIRTIITPAILFGVLLNISLYKGIVGIIAAIPHYTLEVFGFCVILSSLYELNKAIVRKLTNLFRKHKKDNYSIIKAFKAFLIAYLVLALPMIVIAAFLETYLADWIFRLFN
ncbi:stage II sporulation protein M [Staphylococcus felis]|uniref:stage II sporulation protein M n=1 Tax=Staphylococcus felis TaxID=46127 RepID=UPI0024801E4F|nr:stage II sporulation protein M [Staphylococcus felis]MDQ7193023.1 stage II sporulation protein M [Staphylococcus felis]